MKKYLFLFITLLFIPIGVFADTYSFPGDYSVESLTRNFNLITFGLHDNHRNDWVNKGDLYNVRYTGGPVLVNGNVSGEQEIELARMDTNYVSYISGEMGDNVYTDANIATNQDFVDFEEMYVHVVNEQKLFLEKATPINNDSITISSPGIYTIQNTANYYETSLTHLRSNDYDYYAYKIIIIEDYNPNEYYVFNFLNSVSLMNYDIVFYDRDNSNYVPFKIYIQSHDYTGNIIFSYPNALYLELVSFPGTILAPKADVLVVDSAVAEAYVNGSYQYVGYYGNIYANSIVSNFDGINFIPNNLSKKIVNETVKGYTVEYENYSDDLYSGSYSLTDMLKNYSIVSLGQKNYEANSKFLTLNNYRNGSVALFHIAGQFLINGDLGITNNEYPSKTGYGLEITNAMRLDLESNFVTESNIAGDIRVPYITKFWKLHGDLVSLGSMNLLFTSNSLSDLGFPIAYSDFHTANDLLYDAYRTFSYEIGFYQRHYQYHIMGSDEDYINYQRLYDNIVSQQASIKKGQGVSPSNGVVHVEVGSNYVIDNINDVSEIIIDDFEKNKDEVTIITINDSGAIHFPKVSKNSDGYRGVVTNDYYGKEEATYQYEYSHFVTDTYHGNVIWNVPNASFIELAADAPFFGHLIAPNADVETPELHFAGCFIVNSLYCEGNTEAHFYPLTADTTNIYYTGDDGVQRVVAMRIGKALGEDYIKVDKIVLGDYDEYLEDLRREESEGVPIINPYTFRTINVLIILFIVSMVVIYMRSRKKEIER